VYADSLNAVSNDDFRFTGDAAHPDISKTFEQSIDKVAALPCDVLLSVHPDFSDTFDKESRRQEGKPNPFVDKTSCRTYAEHSRTRLKARLAKESSP
jgi:metallo-beta-lactamase class B